MSQPQRSAFEQQLAQQLQLHANQRAAAMPPLPWTPPRQRGWQWLLLPVASAAAIAWLSLGQTTHSPVPDVDTFSLKPPMLIAENYHLEALDQRIQQAYVRGADDQTIAQLWQQRQYWTEQQRLTQELTQ